MQQDKIGELIFSIRERRKMKPNEISYGICTSQDLSKFETGNRRPNIFLMCALLQRMGMSVDKMELFLIEEEESLFVLRKEIEELICGKEYEKSMEKLSILESRKESKQPLHRQFIAKIKSLLEYFLHQNPQAAIRYAQEALSETHPDYGKPRMWEQTFHFEEMFLLLMLCFYYKETGEEERSISLLYKVKSAVEQQYPEANERVKLYPQIMYLLATILEARGEYIEVMHLCNEGRALQQIGGQLYLLPELMRLQAEATKQLGDQDEYETLIIRLSYLQEISNENGYPESTSLAKLFMEKQRGTLYSIRRIIKQNRERLQLSQEKICGDLSPETISRIERGKQKPKLEHYKELLEKMNQYHPICSPLLEVDDFRLLELKAEIEKLSTLRKHEEMKLRIKELEREIKKDSEKNRRYLLHIKTVCDLRLGEIKPEEALRRMKEVFENTLTIKTDEVCGFAIEEVKKAYIVGIQSPILVLIASILYQMGHRADAVTILRGMLENFDKNTSLSCNYFQFSIPVRVNITGYLEEMDDLDGSLEKCEEGIRISLQNDNIRVVDELLANKAYTLIRMDEKNGDSHYRDICKRYYRQSFHLSEILEHEYVSGVVKKLYEGQYQEDIV